MEQMWSSMSASRKTNGWPLYLLCNMLNLALMTAYVIYDCTNTRDKKESVSRRDLVLKMAGDLINADLKDSTSTLRRDVREFIREILQIEQNADTVEPLAGPPRKVRALCPSKSRKMATNFCAFYKNATYREHNIKVCPGCDP